MLETLSFNLFKFCEIVESRKHCDEEMISESLELSLII